MDVDCATGGGAPAQEEVASPRITAVTAAPQVALRLELLGRTSSPACSSVSLTVPRRFNRPSTRVKLRLVVLWCMMATPRKPLRLAGPTRGKAAPPCSSSRLAVTSDGATSTPRVLLRLAGPGCSTSRSRVSLRFAGLGMALAKTRWSSWLNVLFVPSSPEHQSIQTRRLRKCLERGRARRRAPQQASGLRRRWPWRLVWAKI